MHDSSATQAKRFSSSDFCSVPDRPGVKLPAKLIDRAGARGAVAVSDAFSDERRHPVRVIDLPSFSLSMTIGQLVGRQSSRRHRHNYETILYICEGRGVTVIEDRMIEWEAGDAVYIPVWAWHHHENRSADGDCLYIACENAPLLQNLGQIALRQEQS